MTTYKKMLPAKVQFLVVHCADSKPSMDIGVKEIRVWHLQRDFFDIGYHYVIRRDGTVEKGRPDDQPGAHVSGYNGKSLGICMVGGMSETNPKVKENNFTDEQFTALRKLLVKLRDTYPTAKIVGHRDLARGKECPAFDVAEVIAQWNACYDLKGVVL